MKNCKFKARIAAIIALSNILALTSCVDEYKTHEFLSRDLKDGEVELTANLDDATKTSLDSEYKVNWCKGDSVKYYSATAGTVRTHIVERDCQSTAFVATLDSTVYINAVYGAHNIRKHSADSLVFDGPVKAIQDGSFANAHLAASKVKLAGTRTLGFKNLTSLIKFTVTQESVDSIVFQAMDNTRIQADGKMKIKFVESGENTFTPTAYFALDEDGVPADGSTISVKVKGQGTYYLSTLPTDIPGFCITLYSKGSCLGYVNSDKTMNLAANTVLDLSTLTPGTRKVKPLRFSANSAQTVSMSIGNPVNLQYSYDQKIWTDWDGTAKRFGVDSTIYVIGNNPKEFSTVKKTNTFSFGDSSVPVYASGSVMSLINPEIEVFVIPCSDCFHGLFDGCSSLVTAPELPATTLKSWCYTEMFASCTSLATAPQLPAKSVPYCCYYEMFQYCTSLEKVPELPASDLGEGCYSAMFQFCRSLKEAPDLPANILSKSCYRGMFEGCTSLITPPKSIGSTLAEGCCQAMFNGCTSMLTTPELPAKKMEHICYYSMFDHCTSLKSAPELPATDLAEECYCQMFAGDNIKEAPELKATTMAKGCYKKMFYGCHKIETASKLPAKELADACYQEMYYYCFELKNVMDTLYAENLAPSCYDGMFYGCRSLKNAPVLPAKVMANCCYKNMFRDCYSITEAPTMPATYLAPYCYSGMFEGCNRIEIAPELNADPLAEGCYQEMFSSCYRMTTPPDLPATELVSKCYENMFFNCQSMKTLKVDFTTVPSSTFLGDTWLYNSAKESTGTLTINKNATWAQGKTQEELRTILTVPENWTVVVPIE